MSDKHTISPKKVQALYGAVSDEIMDARIEISKLLQSKDGLKVDAILSKLCYSAPQKAIDLFLKKTP